MSEEQEKQVIRSAAGPYQDYIVLKNLKGVEPVALLRISRHF